MVELETKVQSTVLFVKIKVELETEVQRTDLYIGDKQKKTVVKSADDCIIPISLG